MSRILPAIDGDARDSQQPGSPAPPGASQSGSDGNSLTLGESSARFLIPEISNIIMGAMTDCTGGLMHAEQRREPLPQAPFDAIAPVGRSESAFITGFRNTRPEAEPAKDSEERIGSLQQRICELLIKNQQLRMSLESAIATDRGEQDDRSV